MTLVNLGRQLHIRRPIVGIGIVPRRDGNDHVHNDQQRTLEVIRRSITEEIAHHENGQDQENNHEDLKVEVHVLTKPPTDDHSQRSIEESRLDGWTETMRQGEVDLVVPMYKMAVSVPSGSGASNTVQGRGVGTKLHRLW